MVLKNWQFKDGVLVVKLEYKEIQNLADEISNRKIKAIFIETTISPATIEALKAAVQDKGHDVVIGAKNCSLMP